VGSKTAIKRIIFFRGERRGEQPGEKERGTCQSIEGREEFTLDPRKKRGASVTMQKGEKKKAALRGIEKEKGGTSSSM